MRLTEKILLTLVITVWGCATIMTFKPAEPVQPTTVYVLPDSTAKQISEIHIVQMQMMKEWQTRGE